MIPSIPAADFIEHRRRVDLTSDGVIQSTSNNEVSQSGIDSQTHDGKQSPYVTVLSEYVSVK